MSGKKQYGSRVLKMAAAASAIALVLTGCASGGGSNDADDSPIVVGNLMPLTGPLAALGTEMQQGTEIAREIVNDEGGINGRQIEWQQIDAVDADAARQGAERLANEDVQVNIGTYGSALSLAAAPVISRAGNVLVEVGAQAMEVTTSGFPGVYRVNGHASGQGEVAVKVAVDVVAEQLGVDPKSLKIVFAGLDTTYGKDIANGINAELKDQGMPPLAEEFYYAGDTTDFSPIALNIQKAAPDILMAASYPADAVALGRAMKATGFQPKAVIGTGGAHNDLPWLEAMGNDANGVFSVGPTATVNQDALNDEARARTEDFHKRYEEKYGHAPGAHATMGFDGAWTAFQVLKTAKEPTAEGFEKAAKSFSLEKGSLLNGDGVKFGEDGQNELWGYSVNQWQDGVAVVVYPEATATGEPGYVPLPAWGQ